MSDLTRKEIKSIAEATRKCCAEFGHDLNYTPASLKQLDVIFDRFRAEGSRSHEMAGTCFAIGCYLGEVILRHCTGAKWSSSSETIHLDDHEINIFGKPCKRLDNGPEDSLWEFYNCIVDVASGRLPVEGMGGPGVKHVTIYRHGPGLYSHVAHR